MSLPFTQTELNEIKLRAHQQKDDMVLALFEHIENPEHITKLKSRISELEAEVADYREQNTDLEKQLNAFTNA